MRPGDPVSVRPGGCSVWLSPGPVTGLPDRRVGAGTRGIVVATGGRPRSPEALVLFAWPSVALGWVSQLGLAVMVGDALAGATGL